MFFKEKKEKSQQLRNFILIAVIILGLIFVTYLLIAQKEKPDQAVADNSLKREQMNEVEKLKAGNEDIVEKARSLPGKIVRNIDETDNYFGDLSAPVQIIIYDDFECPFCARFYDTINKVKEEFKNKVVIAFRHFPLRSHPNAVPAAMASECAAEQGKFWEMHDRIFEANKERNLNAEQYKKDAKDLGLEIVEFMKCFETNKYKDRIQEQMVEGKNISVTGTPGNFINGTPYPGAIPFDDYTSSDGELNDGMKSIIEGLLNS